MKTFKSFEEVLYAINAQNFENIAVDLHRFQVQNNPVYRAFADYSRHDVVRSIESIPFLPISFFKTQEIQTGVWTAETTFTSSGTTGSTVSRHRVKDLSFYLRHAERLFVNFFGSLDQYHFLALLPSYLERDGSSLVAMADYFIRQSKSTHSGFYLYNYQELAGKLEGLKKSGRKIILLGVTFALQDFAEQYSLDLSECLVMETGGMKGKRREIIREELHAFLCSRLNTRMIMSEYGMTELFSQAYAMGNGRFQAPANMKIMIRDINDPQQWLPEGKTGVINVIDLANFHSCAFIETQDIGKTHPDGTFEVLGRMDNSDVRGCNLLVE